MALIHFCLSFCFRNGFIGRFTLPKRYPFVAVGRQRPEEVGARHLPQGGPNGLGVSAVQSLELYRDQVYSGEHFDGGFPHLPLESESDDDGDVHHHGPIGESQRGGVGVRGQPAVRDRSFGDTFARFTGSLVGSRHARPDLDEAHGSPL